MSDPTPLDKPELLKLGDRHDVVIWEKEDGRTIGVRAIAVVHQSGLWGDLRTRSPLSAAFYSLDDLPRILMAWMMEKATSLKQDLLRDQVVYGTSFELEGRRVDPTSVVLSSDGTYTVARTGKHTGAPSPNINTWEAARCTMALELSSEFSRKIRDGFDWNSALGWAEARATELAQKPEPK